MLYDSAIYGPSFTLDGLTINGSTDVNGCDWILTSEKGWYGRPAVKNNRVDKPASAGTFIGDEYLSARVVSLGGRLSAPDAATLRTAVDQLLGVCPDAAPLYTLSCTDEREQTRAALVRLDGEILVQPVAWNAVDFSIQLTAPDPRKVSTSPRVMTAGLVAPGVGGLAYPVTYPASYGRPGASGSLVLPNVGNAPADVVLTVTGPAVSPVLTNPATGDVMAYQGSLAANDQLVIDTATGRVLLNGVDRRSLLSVLRWPLIPPTGTLQLVFTSAVSSDMGTVVAQYADTYF